MFTFLGVVAVSLAARSWGEYTFIFASMKGPSRIADGVHCVGCLDDVGVVVCDPWAVSSRPRRMNPLN